MDLVIEEQQEEDVLSLKNAFAALPDAETDMDVSETPVGSSAAAAALHALFREDSGDPTIPQSTTIPPAAQPTPVAALFGFANDSTATVRSTRTSTPSIGSLWGSALGGGGGGAESVWQSLPALPDTLGSIWGGGGARGEDAATVSHAKEASQPTIENVSNTSDQNTLQTANPSTTHPNASVDHQSSSILTQPGIVPERVEQYNQLARSSILGSPHLLVATGRPSSPRGHPITDPSPAASIAPSPIKGGECIKQAGGVGDAGMAAAVALAAGGAGDVAVGMVDPRALHVDVAPQPQPPKRPSSTAPLGGSLSNPLYRYV